MASGYGHKEVGIAQSHENRMMVTVVFQAKGLHKKMKRIQLPYEVAKRGIQFLERAADFGKRTWLVRPRIVIEGGKKNEEKESKP